LSRATLEAPDTDERAPGRYQAWGLTWLAYASYYLCRKGFSVTKKTLHDEHGISESALGAIDTAYLSAYAAGQFVSGFFGDRIGARRLVGFGMLVSALCCFLFGASSSALAFGIFFGVNGLAQATGWPGTTRAMAEWTTPKNRGTVMAFWATCYQVGGMVATPLAGLLAVAYGWRAAFFGPAALVSVVALAVLALLEPGPAVLKTKVAAGELGIDPKTLSKNAQRAVLKNPVLWCYGASYFFVKFIRYALLFWLPYYLSTRLGYATDKAAWVATSFEAGGVLGVIVLGRLSDKVSLSRSAVSALSLVGLSLALIAYVLLGGQGTLVNVTLFGLVGALLFGPDALLSGASAQDAGGPHAAAMATGFVNGVGSLGGILEGLLVPPLVVAFGWGALFPLLVLLALAAALALVPALRGPAPDPA
jgi:sugar phosphate permease